MTLKFYPFRMREKTTIIWYIEVTVKATDAESFPREYYTLVDAHNGEVLYRHNKINYFAANTDVNVTATVYMSM